MDREAWRAAVHGAAKSRTQLSNRTELNESPSAESSVMPCRKVSGLGHMKNEEG